MIRVIMLVFVIALAGCERTADSSVSEPTAPSGELNATEAGASAGVAAPTDSQSQGPTAHVFQFGIYKALRKGQLKDSSETNTGKVIRKPTLEHVSMTDRIPLLKETYFGYQYRLFDLPPEALIKPVMELKKVLIHPQMTLPDGSKTTGWERHFKGRVETQQVMGFDGYVFNEDYELVEGDWIFQIWYQDKKLIERKFVSYRPVPATAAAQTEKE